MAEPADLTLANLGSGDPERIRSALQDLKRRHEVREEFALPLLRIALLDPFGAMAPSDVQRLFLYNVARYRAFSPAPSVDDRITVMTALVLRYGDFGCAYQFALRLKIAPDPVAAAAKAIGEMACQGLGIDAAIRGAGYIVSNLLDGRPPVRAVVIEGLRAWPAEPAYQAAVDHVKPELEADELVRLGR